MKVLIPIEQSKFSEAALESVTKNPWWGDTEFLVINVVQIIAPTIGDFSPHYREIRNIQTAETADAQELVNHSVTRLKEAIPYCSVAGAVEEGNITDEIVSKANQWGADIIVMGSHGRKGWSRLMLGSVAESVLNRAPCSVEIIKAWSPKCAESSEQSTVNATKHN